ncbi:MAG: oxidoreductase [Gammaproteobacteria bacterium]|nr:oxidoreductase [Gammaproteobacteria bacterium]
MQMRKCSMFEEVSTLTLGGGGLGQVWGETTREEAVATVHMAVEKGINHFDLAPMYGKGEAETVIGISFKGMDLSPMKFTTKCMLGNLPANEVYDFLNRSLTRSLVTMGLEKVDLFLLHSQLVEDNFLVSSRHKNANRFMTPLNLFFDTVIPAFERLRVEGKIGGWGFGLGQQEALEKAIVHEISPSAVQCVVNPLNSAGGMAFALGDLNPRSVLEVCRSKPVPVLAIRALQAGALASSMDRKLSRDDPDRKDFDRALGFREIAREFGQSPARLAYRYALSVSGISSVILGVKNRDELTEALEALSDKPLETNEIELLEQAC